MYVSRIQFERPARPTDRQAFPFLCVGLLLLLLAGLAAAMAVPPPAPPAVVEEAG